MEQTKEEQKSKEKATEEIATEEKDTKEKDTDLLPMKKWVWQTMMSVIIIGFLAPFLVQAVLPFFRDKPSEDFAVYALNIWNQYTSIVLGICATLMSVLSLIMGFDTLEKSHESEIKSVETNQKILDDISNLIKGQSKIENKLESRYIFAIQKNTDSLNEHKPVPGNSNPLTQQPDDEVEP